VFLGPCYPQAHSFSLHTLSWPKGENMLDRFGSVA
jgi:hypothetical protein